MHENAIIRFQSIAFQDTRKEIFPMVVDYAKVQSKVTLKYDYWHKEVLQKFGTSLGKNNDYFECL